MLKVTQLHPPTSALNTTPLSALKPGFSSSLVGGISCSSYFVGGDDVFLDYINICNKKGNCVSFS